jgi:hypothetical protein
MEQVEIRTREKYSINIFGNQVLKLITEAKIEDTWKEIEVTEIDIPKEIPKYWTKLQLWQHSDYQLKELERLRKLKGEKTPSATTLKEWKLWLESEK